MSIAVLETAKVTVSGRVYAAVAPSADRAETAKTFSATRDLLVIDEKARQSVESTLAQTPSEKAWETRPSQWCGNGTADMAALFGTDASSVLWEEE
jgi:hypothetical protein